MQAGGVVGVGTCVGLGVGLGVGVGFGVGVAVGVAVGVRVGVGVGVSVAVGVGIGVGVGVWRAVVPQPEAIPRNRRRMAIKDSDVWANGPLVFNRLLIALTSISRTPDTAMLPPISGALCLDGARGRGS